MRVDLEAELFAAQRALTPFERGLLLSLGIPELPLAWAMVGAAEITLHGNQYELGGQARAFITPVRVVDPTWPEVFAGAPPEEIRDAVGGLAAIDAEAVRSVVRFGHLVDLVAWHSDAPNMWALRGGSAEWLGATPPEEWIVRRTVLDWLRAGCTGIVPLSHDWRARQRLLQGARTVYVSDLDHAIELRQLMERPTVVPNIKVRGNENGGAKGPVAAAGKQPTI